jgi:hypothetical protein
MSFASLRLGPRVPAARAPHARPPPCYLRLARVMKAPPRPLSQKRAAEGLQGRVRRARVYVLSPAAGAARRSTPLPLRGPRASLERFTHYSDGFYGVFLPENAQNPCCSVAVKKESILSRTVNLIVETRRGYPVFDPSAPLSVLYRTILSQSILALKRPSIGKPFLQTCRAPAGCGGYSSSTVGFHGLATRLPAYPSAQGARGKKR